MLKLFRKCWAIATIYIFLPDNFVHKVFAFAFHFICAILIKTDNAPHGRSMIAPTISTVVRLMKADVSRRAGFSVWQKGFYDHVIRNEKDYREIWTYIVGNPGKWAEDRLNIGVR